jgi:2-aminobenzoate-CoA ligase
VLLRGGNTVEMALAWLGTVYAGLIAVATMPLLRAGELGSIIDRAQPTLALCDGRLLAELQAAQTHHPALTTIVPFHTAPDAADLLQRAQGKPGTTPPCPTSADDIALMAFTSGTTGAPKAAVHTHRDVLAGCEAWPRHVLKATPDDIVAGSPPLAFTFGLGGLLVFPMGTGGSVYFPDQPYTPETMVRLMRKAGVTICYTAPHLLPADGAVRQADRPASAAHQRERRRGPAGRHTPAAEGGDWPRHDGRHWRHRDVSHFHLFARR